MMSMLEPIATSEPKPKIFSHAAFQTVMRP